MVVNRCLSCMESLEPGTVKCPYCGFEQNSYEPPVGCLPANIILDGQYLLGRLLGQGGFGKTYVGYDLKLDIKVAIKEYYPVGYVSRKQGEAKVFWSSAEQMENGSSGKEDFLREARKMAKIDWIPATVRVRNIFYENDTAYIVMDYVEGETMKEWLMRKGPISPRECLDLLSPIMDALEQLHRLGIIHRDISPDNIMLEPNGKARLLDLGAAKQLAYTKTWSINSRLVAKKGFSPPEQYSEQGNIGSWTDVYSLCATFFYAVSGRRVPDSIERMQGDHELHAMMKKLGVPLSLKEVLTEGLQVIAAIRISDMAELKERLSKAILPREPVTPSVPETPAAERVSRENGNEKRGVWGRLFGFLASPGEQHTPPPAPAVTPHSIPQTDRLNSAGNLTNHAGNMSRLVARTVLIANPNAFPTCGDGRGETVTSTIMDSDATVFEEEGMGGFAWLERAGQPDSHTEVTKCRFIMGRQGRGKRYSDGRVEPPADFILFDPEKHISRRQAAILFDGTGFYLENLSTRNTIASGTFLNGIPLEARSGSENPGCCKGYPLKDGDHIGMGAETVIFHTTGGTNR